MIGIISLAGIVKHPDTGLKGVYEGQDCIDCINSMYRCKDSKANAWCDRVQG